MLQKPTESDGITWRSLASCSIRILFEVNGRLRTSRDEGKKSWVRNGTTIFKAKIEKRKNLDIFLGAMAAVLSLFAPAFLGRRKWSSDFIWMEVMFCKCFPNLWTVFALKRLSLKSFQLDDPRSLIKCYIDRYFWVIQVFFSSNWMHRHF